MIWTPMESNQSQLHSSGFQLEAKSVSDLKQEFVGNSEIYKEGVIVLQALY